MAVDEALLVDAAESGIAALRFYQWSEPTLSLGYFQRYEDRHQHAASRDAAIVRRQTGGGAILHDRELTYSITLPAAHPLARGAQQLYRAVHESFIAVLSPLIADNGLTLRCHAQVARLPTNEEAFLCFQRRAGGDVLLVAEAAGGRTGFMNATPVESKILGSAQRRHRGAILQHGSLLLCRSPFAPELAGWSDLTGRGPTMAKLVESLTVRLQKVLQAPTLRSPLGPELESKIAERTNSKYGSAAWTKRR